MKVSAKSYPFPVLGNLDDIKGRFNPSMKYTLEPNRVILECNIDLSNETIEDLIASNSASFYVQVECASTFFRRTYRSNDAKILIEIDAGDVRDKVTVKFLVCANVAIQEYDPVGIHPDLAGDSSVVEPGDVLADGGSGWFMADKTFDPLKAPLSSFMKIMKGSYKSGPMSISYDDDRIVIVLAESDYEKYFAVRNYSPHTLHSALVLPALIDVLYTMQRNKEQYEDLPWFSKIQQIAVQQQIDLSEPITAAQQILGQPIGRSLDEINRNSGVEEDA